MSRIEKIRKLLSARPDDVELHFMLAMEHRAAGEYDSAAAQFDTCIQMKPEYAAAYFQKSNTFIAAGRLDEAREVLSTGIDTARTAGDLHAVEEMSELLRSLD